MSRAGVQHRQRGFLVIAAVFLLVVLAGLVAYLMTVSSTSQAASAADANSARAYQAARAGIEWGAYQLLRNPLGAFATSTCTGGAPTQVNVTMGAFTATVRCTSTSVTEGANTMMRSYSIESNGCNQPTAGPAFTCPNPSTSSTYVERQITVSIVQ